MTTEDTTLARLEAVLSRLERLERLAAPPTVTPFAAGDMPSTVANGELIESAWGNQVVGSLEWLRGEVNTAFVYDIGVHTTGAYTLGTVSLPAVAYARRVTAWANFEWGNSGAPCRAQHYVRPVLTTDGERGTQPQTCETGQWGLTPIAYAWNVPAGSDASFQLVTNLLSSSGYLHVHGVFNTKRITDN